MGANIIALNPNNGSRGYSAHIAAGRFVELLCLMVNARERRTEEINPTN